MQVPSRCPVRFQRYCNAEQIVNDDSSVGQGLPRLQRFFFCVDDIGPETSSTTRVVMLLLMMIYTANRKTLWAQNDVRGAR
jgi:hypothetical protein